MHGWCDILAAASIVLVSIVRPIAIASLQTVADEYRLKAAFLYRFPEFVEYPQRALQGRKTIDLCVLAPSPFGSVLRELAEGEALGDRALSVREVDEGHSLDTCQVLFLPAGVRARRAILQQVAKLPILTVSDAPQFLDDGGIVQLSLVDKRVRFEINVAAADRAGLRLNSQLLRLAVSVRGEPL